MGVIRLPEYLPPPPRRQSIPVPGMLHSAFLHLPFLGPPAFGCLGHGELARYCHGIATVLLRCCDGVAMVLFPWVSLVHPLYIPCTSLVHPLYIPCTSLVHPFYSGRAFVSHSVSPPSPGLDLTAFFWPRFKGNRISP